MPRSVFSPRYDSIGRSAGASQSDLQGTQVMPGTSAFTYSSPFGDAPTGYGEYDMLFAANPYRKQTYQSTWWDRLKDALGFKSGYDAWLENTSTQIAEYDAGIYSLIQQNQYNSPSAQAQRMSDAGLNPDLLGTGDVASAAQPAEDANGMPQSVGDNVAGVVGQFATSMISAFSTGMQIYKGMAEVKQISETINSIATQNADAVLNVVDKIIVGSVPLSVLESGKGVDSYVNAVDLSKYGFKGSGLVTAQEAFKDRFDSIKNNAELRKAVYERYNALSNTYKVGSEGFIPESQQPVSPDELFNIQTATMARAARRILELSQTNKEFQESVLNPQQQANEFMEGEVVGQELNVLSGENYGEAVASNKMTGIDADTFMKQAQRILNEERANMYSVLAARASSGDSLSSAILHAMALQDMMQIDFSTGIDLSFLKGLGNLAGSIFSFGKNGSMSTQSAADSFRKSFGSGINFNLGIKTK